MPIFLWSTVLIQLRQPVAGPLQEQHRKSHIREVVCPRIRVVPRPVKRESVKHDPLDAGEWRFSRRSGRHPSAHRLAAREQRQVRGELGRGPCGGPDGFHQGAAPIGHSPAGGHERKLVSKRSDPPGGQRVRGRFHERVPHSRARAVREQVQRRRRRRPQEYGSDGSSSSVRGFADRDLEFCGLEFGGFEISGLGMGGLETVVRTAHTTGARSSAGASDQALPSQRTGRAVVSDAPISNHHAASRPSIVALPPQNTSGGISYRKAW